MRVKDIRTENVTGEANGSLIEQSKANVIVGIIDAVFVIETGAIVKRRAIDEVVADVAIDQQIDGGRELIRADGKRHRVPDAFRLRNMRGSISRQNDGDVITLGGERRRK